MGVQRGGLGGASGGGASLGALRPSAPPRPGSSTPGGRPVRARAQRPPPARAPLSGAPGPASAAAGCLSPAGLHGRGARTSPAGSRAPGSAGHRRAQAGGAAAVHQKRSDRRKAASARAAGGKGCPGGCGLVFLLPLLHQTAKLKWRVWGAVGRWEAKRVWGRARVVALRASLVSLGGNPPTGPSSSLPPSLPLPPPLNLLVTPEPERAS